MIINSSAVYFSCRKNKKHTGNQATREIKINTSDLTDRQVGKIYGLDGVRVLIESFGIDEYGSAENQDITFETNDPKIEKKLRKIGIKRDYIC